MILFEYVLYVAIAAVTVAILFCLAHITRTAWRDGLLWIGRFGYRSELVQVPCRECDGYGIQVLTGGRRINLTRATRDRKKGTWHWGAPLGNKASCLNCKGFGFTWGPRTMDNTHHYDHPPRSAADVPVEDATEP